jgi:hypothetical protein
MPTDPVSLLVLLLSVGAAFLISRRLSSRWRHRRRERAEKEARSGESRQARRARARREKGPN